MGENIEVSLKSRVEAVLFTTAKALNAKEIGDILGEEEDVAQDALLDLIMDYSSRDGAVGWELFWNSAYIKKPI